MRKLVAVDITKKYRTSAVSVSALNGVNLSIHAGEMLAISGPSGSGKSTLLNILAGLDRPNSGKIEFYASPVENADDVVQTFMPRGQIGFIFQSFNLIPVLTAIENVELPLWSTSLNAEERCNLAKDMLHRVGLGERIHHRPDGLSGGQQQRVAVARALVTKPSIVFADEPTANLDSKTAEQLLHLLSDLNTNLGTTFVFSTHDPRVLHFASRVVHMEDGQICQ